MKFRKRRQFFPSCSSHHQVEEDEARERREKGNKEPRWQRSSSSAHVIAQLAKYMFYEPVVTATGMVGTRSWIGGLFTRSNRRQEKSVEYTLSPLQEERLQRLQDRMVVPFDETRPDHQESLKALWNVAFPNVNLTGLVTEQWKEMGWQGPNPSTDFRGCGFIALENLLFSARTYPVCFRRLLLKQRGDRAKWEYPFAVAGINISFMLIQMLDLQNNPKMSSRNEFPQTLRRRRESIRCTILYSFRNDGCSMACNARFLHGIQ
ncbi:ELMO domain-containing protein 3 isoform X4 [Arabidopsis lyrata subsp. lyrata]|uniref:ELMO domain-containing protein 3 isoform X4 n=1 Tax=Arabidopsis lyrata subsp. lyrata TaxID=81972 RepID=UPI000A29C01B|nr:ELMO domain-containing protein 3 isoform X4 [Arabidopsis lyrata subsp. lyrata]|eukprot:XP_020868687.1 ELMO domain-containing protein 3 isoform X4 [Arabidopsis lyrata subsp. lyrata]